MTGAMRNCMRKLLIAFALAIVVAASALWSVARYWSREERARGLQRDICAFAATHGDRLPNSWNEFLAFVKNTQGGQWSESQLKQFGGLRWGQNLRDPVPDGRYIYIYDKHYQYLEPVLNDEIDQANGHPLTKK
jgi:hypothetical protein